MTPSSRSDETPGRVGVMACDRQQAEILEGDEVPNEIRAATMASVLQIAVAEGDVVQAGDTIAILESMKMEIPVLAEQGGTVGMVAVAEGATLRAGDLIAVVVPA